MTLPEFSKKLEQTFEQAQQAVFPLSLLLIDVDNLKGYNEKCGRHLGDKVLRVIASLLKEEARPEDTVARLLADRQFDWGDRYGDQFALLMPKTTLQQAEVLANRYKRKVAAWPWECGPITVSVSAVARDAQMIMGQELLERASDLLDQQRQSLEKPSETRA